MFASPGSPPVGWRDLHLNVYTESGHYYANRDGTLVTWQYDLLPEGCARTECTNLAGQLAAVRYPVALVDGTVRVQGLGSGAGA